MNDQYLLSGRMGDVPRGWLNRISPIYDLLESARNGNDVNNIDGVIRRVAPQRYVAQVDKLSAKAWSLLLYAAYSAQNLAGNTLAFQFSDGSISPDHELGTRQGGLKEDGPQQPNRPENCETLILGTMSGRHHELDFLVDAYLHTNSTISGVLRRKDIESTCAAHTARALAAIVDGMKQSREQPIAILVELILTGFEPMIIGTCRGIAQFLNQDSSKLMSIRMRYYRGGGKDENTRPFSPQSPGANLSNYYLGPLWV